jgi:hypothetical protein
MTVRSGPGEQTPRAGIATEVIEMWKQLTGPEGNDLGRTARIVAGIAPAAACYVMTTHRGAAADMRIPTRSRRGSVLAISTEHDAAARFAH